MDTPNHHEALTAAENSLRDFIELTLRAKFGDSWAQQLGVSPETLARWRDRSDTEAKKFPDRGIDPRPLYYAQFHDLFPIIKHNWELFKPCFNKLGTLEAYFDKLNDLRDPNAHGRDLLPYEKSLILGISGYIRNAITSYKSIRGTPQEYFPHIEYVSDSLGNVLKKPSRAINTKRFLRPGDQVTFTVTAWDPKGEPLEYNLALRVTAPWVKSNVLTWDVTERHIGIYRVVTLKIRSSRMHHAHSLYDDMMSFQYTVLPPEE